LSNIGKDLELETQPLGEADVLLDGVDRDRDDLGAGGVEVFET
jgi:hypothetical protein